ncbi:MAG: hypothetical protein ACHBNF_13890 [Chromatiales bacterium]
MARANGPLSIASIGSAKGIGLFGGRAGDERGVTPHPHRIEPPTEG